MKAWLLGLLLLNAAFFAWVRFVANAPNPALLPYPGPVRRLELVSERTEGARGRCLSVGPYLEQALAERAAALARTPQRDTRLRHAEPEGASNYRVVLPTSTLQLATSTAMRLRAAGVADLEIIPPAAGATDATVALGVYADRERAQRRIEELQRYAISPVLIEAPRGASSWWVDVAERAPTQGLEAAALLRVLAAPAGVAAQPCPISAGATPPAAAPPAAPATPAPGSTRARPA